MLITNKWIQELSDPCNVIEHYESFIRKKTRKSVKQSEIITYQPKTFENPNIDDIKSFITEHPETWHKLSKAIRKGEKVSSNNSFYSDTRKVKIFWTKKNI